MNWTLIEYDEVGSTLDVAHALAAEGAAAGTVVIADAQTAGRGQRGRAWQSERGAGLWLTLIERPSEASALDVLSLRVGLALAPALDAFADSRVQLKWPNDLYLGARKLGGILIEARWREGEPDWVAIGVGINLRPPAGEARAIGLVPGAVRGDVLPAIVPGLREAAAQRGSLTRAELAAFASRDLAAGRRCLEPVVGTVLGIDASGGLRVDVGSSDASNVTVVRAGSLILEGGA